MRLVLVDNYDSFTFNLLQQLGTLTGEPPLLLRNDDRVEWGSLRAQGYRGIVVSPGPGRPDRPRDFGISASAIRDSGLPVLGVCLGHQGISHLHGGRVVPAPVPMHGRLSAVHHAGEDLFAGLPSPLQVVRYHSLAVEELPAQLLPLAWSDDGVLMAMRHAEAPLWGVQFHPESICTEHGDALLRNFCALARTATASPRARRGAPGGLRLLARELAFAPDAQVAFDALYGEADTAFWLDSSAPRPQLARFSFMGDDAGPLAELVTYDVGARRVTTRAADGVKHADGPLLAHLERRLRERRLATPQVQLPFQFDGGYVGYLGYELKAECGGVAAHVAEGPDAALLFADRFVAFDHERGAVWLVALAADDEQARAAERWLQRTEATLRALPDGSSETWPPAALTRAEEPSEGQLVSWPAGFRPRHPPDRYAELIARCQRDIALGETYEVCLTNAVVADAEIDPWEAYVRLRQVNPAPYAAYLRLPGLAVLSASPERFLHVDPEGAVETKPIKGTAPRGATPSQDAELRERLRTSEKDRSENLMIVDLLRNDLGVACELGSVQVTKLFDVESFATVHQLVSTVRGRLRPGVSTLDLVAAAFPGGSMTGAPKRRTLEIIDELEAGPRGVYSGALGYLALNGAADLSIVIRTIVIADGVASFGAGGAIVALSDPQDELREVRLKARALMQALAPGAQPQVRARDATALSPPAA